jgi:hypothetical protein
MIKHCTTTTNNNNNNNNNNAIIMTIITPSLKLTEVMRLISAKYQVQTTQLIHYVQYRTRITINRLYFHIIFIFKLIRLEWFWFVVFIITWSVNKVHELAIVCLPWWQWTETSVWFHDVGISAFHSCVVVDLWHSLSEWRLLFSECFGVPSRECRNFLLNLARVEAKSEKC